MSFELTNELIINNLKFWYTIVVVFILARALYFPKKGKKEYLFAFTMLSAVIFMICVLIKNVELGLGFAVGIFAIFGIIRYRTIPINTREMTYLFLCIGVAAKNSLVPVEENFLRVLYTDIYILVIVYLLEYVLTPKSKVKRKEVTYTNLDLIHPDKREELKTDLNCAYGFGTIEKIKIGKIDQLKNTAKLQVTFKDEDQNHLEDD